MIEARTTEERISTSIVSGTLESRKDKMMPVDTLTGVGAAARKADPAALNVIHLNLALDIDSLSALVAHAMDRVAIEAGRLKLELSASDRKSLARKAIKYWAAPICHRCHGRRYEQICGTPMLSSRPCKACDGSGHSHFPKSEHGKVIGALVSWLHAVEGDIAYLVRQKMRS